MRVDFRREISWRLLVGTFLLGSFLLRIAIKPLVIPGSGHDDELMVGLAKSISDGNWLGDYGLRGHLTLAKPPGFPIFMAVTSWLPGNVLVWTHMLVLVGIVLIVRAMSFFGLSRGMRLAAVVLLAYFPPLFGDSLSRIYRESLLAALAYLACGLTLTIVASTTVRPDRARGKVRDGASLMLLSFILGWFMITKPGWYALIPLLFVAGFFTLRRWFLDIQTQVSERKRLQARAVRIITIVLVVMVPSFLPSFVVKSANHSRYGLFTQDTFASGAFVDALDQLVRIRPNSGRPYMLVDAGMRASAYRVSPTFRKLKPFLERGESEGWNGPPCGQVGICDESAGWFTWDLRDAVQASGLGDSAKEFDQTLAAIASEIARACESLRVSCGSKGLAPGVLHPSTWSIRLLGNAFFIGARYVWNLPNPGTGGRPPLGEVNPASRELWEWATKSKSLDIPFSNYEPAFFNMSAAIQFDLEVYQFAWRILLLGCVVLFVRQVTKRSASTKPSFRQRFGDPPSVCGLVSLAAVASFVITILSLVALEVSSGVYLRWGGDLYLPAAFPFLIFAAALWFSSSAKVVLQQTSYAASESNRNPDRIQTLD